MSRDKLIAALEMAALVTDKKERLEAIRSTVVNWTETLTAESTVDREAAELSAVGAPAFRAAYDTAALKEALRVLATEGIERGAVELIDCGEIQVEGFPAWKSEINVCLVRAAPRVR